MSKRLELVIDIAQEAEDKAAATLSRLQQQVAEANHQLLQLEEYRDDYIKSAAIEAEQGVNIQRLVDGQRFMLQLEAALSAQRDVVFNREAEVEQARVVWQEAARYTQAVKELCKRRAMEQSIAEEKRQQKMIDDLYSVRKVMGEP